MTKLLYIPNGEYIKWYTNDNVRDFCIIYEKSNFYKEYNMPVQEYLEKFCKPSTWFQSVTKEENKMSAEMLFDISEFEVIYD